MVDRLLLSLRCFQNLVVDWALITPGLYKPPAWSDGAVSRVLKDLKFFTSRLQVRCLYNLHSQSGLGDASWRGIGGKRLMCPERGYGAGVFHCRTDRVAVRQAVIC